MKLKSYLVKENTPAGWLAKIKAVTTDIKASNCVHGFSGVVKINDSIAIMGDDILNEPALNGIVLSHFALAVPRSVTPRQARLALLSIGITEAIVDGAINTLQSPQKEAAFITWKTSTEFHRDNPMVSLLANMLNKTPQELDDLWTLASSL